MREMISDFVSHAPGMELAGRASSGQRALEILPQVNPDVVTLDIQMPGMNGLETLDAILKQRAVPVIMVSSLTQLGADITLEALDRGALDYIAKPERGSETQQVLGHDLLRKIRSAAGTDVQRILEIRKNRKARRAAKKSQRITAKPVPEETLPAYNGKCIALGISTGGPPALRSLFESLRPPMPPIVVVQHMPASFTKPLAWRLDALSELSIKEGETGDILQGNHVYIAPGGRHMEVRGTATRARLLLSDGPMVSSHKPSVDVMMKSAAAVFGSNILGVIMTGMGHDGAEGCGVIRAGGGYVLGQDETSSEVYGMNKVAFVNGNVDRQFSLTEASGTITLQVRRLWAPNSVTA